MLEEGRDMMGGCSWREGGKTRNVHLGSARKMDDEAARQKARERKAEELGIRA
jgi:hypothetical protein